MDNDRTTEDNNIDDKTEEVDFTLNGDLLPNKPLINSSLTDRPQKRLLVRADYIRIHDFIDEFYSEYEEDTTSDPYAVIVTGQPGIGKRAH